MMKQLGSVFQIATTSLVIFSRSPTLKQDTQELPALSNAQPHHGTFADWLDRSANTFTIAHNAESIKHAAMLLMDLYNQSSPHQFPSTLLQLTTSLRYQIQASSMPLCQLQTSFLSALHWFQAGTTGWHRNGHMHYLTACGLQTGAYLRSLSLTVTKSSSQSFGHHCSKSLAYSFSIQLHITRKLMDKVNTQTKPWKQCYNFLLAPWKMT